MGWISKLGMGWHGVLGKVNMRFGQEFGLRNGGAFWIRAVSMVV